MAAPVEDEKLKKRIRDMFRIMMRDNVKARIMLGSGEYVRERRSREKPLNSQEYFYEEAYRRLEDKSSRQEQLRENREKAAGKPAAKRSAPGNAAKTASRRGRKKKGE